MRLEVEMYVFFFWQYGDLKICMGINVCVVCVHYIIGDCCCGVDYRSTRSHNAPVGLSLELFEDGKLSPSHHRVIGARAIQAFGSDLSFLFL